MRSNIAEIWGNAQRIVPQDCENAVNTYALLYKEFELESAQYDLTLRIASDRDHIVLLDGEEVCRGQFSDDPQVKTHTNISIKQLAAGKHTLLVRNYICNEKFLSYAPGQAGVILRLFNKNMELVSDKSWLGCVDPAYQSGVMPKLTMQLGFTARVDLRNALDYQHLDTTAFAPVSTFELDPQIVYRERQQSAIPRLTGVVAAQVIKSGVFFRRNNENADSMTPAELIQRDVIHFYSQNHHAAANGAVTAGLDYPSYSDIPQGVVLLAKLPEEISGFLEFAIEAPAGTVIDLAHGEHIADGRVRARIGQRNFADRFICKEGINRFELPFRRIAAMYLELHILIENTQSITLHHIGVNKWELPLPENAAFNSADPVDNELEERSLRTLKLCMHEHYEDCPWREQALYTYDSRNQMLYGYYLWGNYDYAAASLDLWHGSWLANGHLRLCAPGRMNSVIPIYSFIYPVQLKEHLLYSGDDSCARRNYPLAEKIVQSALQYRDDATGLMIPADRRSWLFYEWAKELSLDGCEEDELHALFTLYFIEALDAMQILNKWLGLPDKSYGAIADELRSAVEKHFFDERTGDYFSRTIDGKGFGLKHEHTQMLMIYNNAVPPEKKDRLYNSFLNGSCERLTFSSMPYLGLLAVRSNGEFFRELLKTRLQEDFAPMLNDSAMGTLYETAHGADDFEFAASMCHGWSALPVYFNHAVLLGVTPLEPGFRTFQVMPWSGNLPHAAGGIVTPQGRISVSWQRQHDGSLALTVKHPAQLKCVINALPENRISSTQISSY